MDEFNTTALPHLQAGEMLRYNLGLYDLVFTSKYGVDADRVCAALAEKYNAFGILTGILDSKQRIFANKENFGKENSLQRK